jgi:hypothetical protein
MRSSLCNFLQPPVASYRLDLNILFNALFSINAIIQGFKLKYYTYTKRIFFCEFISVTISKLIRFKIKQKCYNKLINYCAQTFCQNTLYGPFTQRSRDSFPNLIISSRCLRSNARVFVDNSYYSPNRQESMVLVYMFKNHIRLFTSWCSSPGLFNDVM